MAYISYPKDWKVPVFNRATVASILNITPLTLANRENKGIYPQPRRNAKNRYREYTLSEVFRLQLITFKQLFPLPVGAVLYSIGYKDVALLQQYIDAIMADVADLSVKSLDTPVVDNIEMAKKSLISLEELMKKI